MTEVMTAEETAVQADDPATVSFEGVTKRFGATLAVDDVSVDVLPGTIHAFVGQNGAGKSTCLGMLAGRFAPTSGAIRVSGEVLNGGDPGAAKAARVAAIYQELIIVPALSPQSNVFLGQPLSRRGVLSEKAMYAKYVELCEQLGAPVHPPNTRTGDLSVADQQLIEIMRALVTDARVILFDEPTASLSLTERRTLLALMARLRDEGRTIVFVSHDLDEVLEISDHISVFREGSLVASAPRADWTKRLVVERMLGGESAYRAAQLLRDPDNGATMRRNNRPAKSDSALVQVEGLGVPGTLEAIDLELRSGEILGIGGLVGSGRSTVLRALAGYEPSARGRIWVGGREHSWPRTVTASRRLGIAMIPEDRRSLGLFHGLTSVDNVIVSDFGKASWHGVLGTSKSRNLAAQALTDFEFRDDWLRRPAGNLSGGNQQKLLLARWRHDPPIVLLADEPTRGIDLAAKSTVLATLGQMADGGMAIVFVSSELEEVVYVSERIIVLAQGRKVADVDNDDSQSPVTILHLAFGTDADQPGMAHDHAV